MSKKDKRFRSSAAFNNALYYMYLDNLTELSLAMFDWQNLPETIDPRFLELTLFTDGQAVFFYDEGLGNYLALQVTTGSGGFTVYRVPVGRRAYAVNGYQNNSLNPSNSVIIYNNMLRKNSVNTAMIYAHRLWDLDRTIDINAKAQKTPILLKGSNQQMLTLKNLYMQYDGNMPVLYGDDKLDLNQISVLQTGAPYVGDKLYMLKTQIWNEALTKLGISNINISKKERLITDEVTRNQGGTIANRYSRLNMRQQACEEINRLFGLDIWCEYKDDVRELEDDTMEEGE